MWKAFHGQMYSGTQCKIFPSCGGHDHSGATSIRALGAHSPRLLRMPNLRSSMVTLLHGTRASTAPVSLNPFWRPPAMRDPGTYDLLAARSFGSDPGRNPSSGQMLDAMPSI